MPYVIATFQVPTILDYPSRYGTSEAPFGMHCSSDGEIRYDSNATNSNANMDTQAASTAAGSAGKFTHQTFLLNIKIETVVILVSQNF